jgi:ABC-type lipoprotein release transport system permease subunit
VGSFLYGVTPGDPLTLASVVAGVIAMASIACALPAWRASRLNVLEGLRD